MSTENKKRIDVKPYIAADALKVTGGTDIAATASHNQVAGPGFTVLDGKTPLACGGIRVYGVGVAWFMMNEEAKKSHAIEIIRKANEALEEMQRTQGLCEVIAISVDADKWLKHLGFKEVNHVFVR